MSSVANEEDDASDVSMTEDSDDESDGSSPAAIIVTPQHPPTSNTSGNLSDMSKKRKYTPEYENTSAKQSWETEKSDEHKRIKTTESRLPSDRSQLPTEIWHSIFTFTPPRALGRLLQTNKRFRAYLDPSSPTYSPVVAPLPAKESVARIQSPESIWQAARRNFYPGMPSPLQDCSELEMWKLACTRRCQFCDRIGQPPTPGADKWHSGPGENGVIPIWPFTIRSCGPCLQNNTIKVG